MASKQDVEAKRFAAGTLARNRYTPAAVPICGTLEGIMTGQWWRDAARVRTVAGFFEELNDLACDEVIALYNRALKESLAWFFSGGSPKDFETRLAQQYLITTGWALWDRETFDVVIAAVALENDGEVEGDHLVLGWHNLEDACRAAMKAADPSPALLRGEKTLADYRRELKISTEPLTERYYRAISDYKDASCIYNTNFKILARRAPDRSRPLVEVWLDEAGDAASLFDEAVLITAGKEAAILGSWHGIEVLVEVSQGASEAAPKALRALRNVTGNNFYGDFQLWREWLARAKAELTWDIDKKSFHPADRWQKITKELQDAAAEQYGQQADLEAREN